MYSCFPCEKQIPNRQRPHFRLYFVRKKRMNKIRFSEVTCHFCKKLVGGNTYINCKPEFISHLVFDSVCSFNRWTKQSASSCHIHKSLINGKLLNSIRILTQNVHKRPGILFVYIMARWHKHKVRILTNSIHNRFSCGDIIFLCRNRLCKNYAMSGGNITANGRRYLTKINLLALFKPLHCLP